MKKYYKNLMNMILRRIYSTNRNFIPISESGFWKYRYQPTKSLKKTSSEFNRMHGKTIIEIGTGIHGKLAGNSMLFWTRKTNAEKIIAVDLEQKRLDEVYTKCKKYSNVELVNADGIEYLKKYSGKIDLLYLDFWTPDQESFLLGSGRADAYKEIYLVSKNKLNKNSLILIDDTDHIHPWKHTYIIPLARKDGFQVLYTGRQTLLKR